jgi:2-polyprenyl-3-methyl-5-hydroxy-6-metoxy-1,4-benzoquinol methylase
VVSQKIIDQIVPGVLYQDGFLQNGVKQPFYDFCQKTPESGWSDELVFILEESTRNHPLDIYNRKIVLDGIKVKLSEKKGANLIDLGCSSGYLLEEVYNNFPETNIFGADYFVPGLLQCHRHWPQIPLFRVDLTQNNLPPDFFDVVTCLNVLEHIKDDGLAFAQLFRIARDGGLVVVTVPAGPRLFDLYDKMLFHFRRYSLEELVKKAKNSGFKILKANYFACFVYPIFYLAKRWHQIQYEKKLLKKNKINFLEELNSRGRFPLLTKIFEAELLLGKKLRYPFGIRAYIIAKKV